MRIERLMVIGAGQMGGGIAQVASQAGLQVLLNDLQKDIVERRIALIDNILQRSIDKKSLSR